MAAQRQAPSMRVVIIAPVEALDQDWIRALQADPSVTVLARVGVVQRGIAAVQQYQPDVLLIDRTVEQAEQALQMIGAVAPRTLCIALLDQHDMTAVRRLVAAGARDILVKPIRYRKLLASMHQVLQLAHVRPARALLPAPQPRAEPTVGGSVIVVMGPKGGVGTTTVAANLAVALKQISSGSVALADFNLQCGDVGVLLNVWSMHTLHDLALEQTAIDDHLLDRVLVPHTSGVKVLVAPNEPEQSADLDDTHVGAIVEALRARFAYVVIDCWSRLDPITTTLMRAADQVLLVTTPEVPALNNTKQTLAYLARHGVQHERVALVVNRFPSIKGVTLRDIEQHLRHPIQANLPSDGPAVTSAANKGVPLVERQPESWVAQSLLKLAAWIAGDDVVTISSVPSSPAPLRHPRWRLSLRRTNPKHI